MSPTKQASTKRKRSIKKLPVLSAAGLSLSLASGGSAAIGRTATDTTKTEMIHEIALCEEEISDVSLATFYVFDNETAKTLRRGVKLAQGGCGCSVGCGGGEESGGGLTSSYSVASPVRRYSNPPGYPSRKYAKPSKHRHVSR
jgi:hypothetical protein